MRPKFGMTFVRVTAIVLATRYRAGDCPPYSSFGGAVPCGRVVATVGVIGSVGATWFAGRAGSRTRGNNALRLASLPGAARRARPLSDGLTQIGRPVEVPVATKAPYRGSMTLPARA